MPNTKLIHTGILALLVFGSHELGNASPFKSKPQIAFSESTLVDFAKFKPTPQRKIQIDYDVWDSLLEEMVLYTGPSTRKHISRPAAVTGSRFFRGHTSKYRLEGNRIPYSKMNPGFKDALAEYRKDLERVGTDVKISTLSKNEQLAYWLNLHNAVLIEQIAKAYPLRRPKNLRVGENDMSLHDAKIITISNTKLSLRDIREEIVYPNWKNPKVIYGFHLGDIGSPSIQNTAFNAKNVSDVLDRSANEFVNSLRGFYVRNDINYVSELYSDVARFYFTDFDKDLTEHLKVFMREDVKNQLVANKTLRNNNYETIIADMTAGLGDYKSISQLETTSRNSLSRVAGSPIREYMQELIKKRETLERQGLIGGGTVIIEDIPTENLDNPPVTEVD